MNFENNILQYQLCIKCNNNIAKIGTKFCKKCHIKPIKSNKIVAKKDSSQKIYYYKFQNRNTKSRLLLSSSNSNDGYSLCIEPSTSNVRSFQPIENNTLLLIPAWDQFRSLKEFTTYIIQADQISYPYFILSCHVMIQSLPKFQKFVQNSANDLPSNKLSQDFILPFPLTNAMQLLCQASFWDDLILIYFNEFHPMCPLFSIRTFDKSTASTSLLSAMYLCAFRFSKNRPREVSEYMKTLATQNIKKIVKKVTLDNMRALAIHSFIAQLDMKLDLVKSLYAHLTRMGYLIGLHLDCSRLTSVDRYNRNLLFSAIRAVNLGLSGSHNFSPNFLTEYGKEDLNLYDTKWQLPSPSSLIYFETQAENQLYSICITKFSRFCEIMSKLIFIPTYINLDTGTFTRIWNSNIKKLKLVFENTFKELEELKVKYSGFEEKIKKLQTQLKISYYDALLDLYELLKHKNKSLKPEEISATLEYCHNLYQVIKTAEKYSPYSQFFCYIIGLHYLNSYPKSTESEKAITKQRLKDLIQFIKEKIYSHFSLNYLLLKTGYDALDDL